MEIVDNYYYTPNFNSVDWKYKYWAVDWDGRAFFYEEEPYIADHKDYWSCKNKESLRWYDYQFDFFANSNHIVGKIWRMWRNSLIIKGEEVRI